MRSAHILALAGGILCFAASGAFCDSSGRIYGKITTTDGDVYQGLIRWDKNEASWCDVFNGDKSLDDDSHRRRPDRRSKITVFGIPIGERLSTGDIGSAQSGTSFGNITTIEVLGREAVRVTFKSGEKLRMAGGSSDIGNSIRGIVIEDAKEGQVELDWGDLERIDFMPADPNLTSTFGDRLYGTLTTRRGDEYTGWVAWDADELFTKDIIDGEHNGHSRKIEFGKIKSIRRHTSEGATITLSNGDEIVLQGTNDVDDGNRGITIHDPGFGTVTVDWDEFDRLDLKTPRSSFTYDDFDGGRPLHGTVYTVGGGTHAGTIRWDNDEEYTWELLDGSYHGGDFDVPFRAIKDIQREGHRSAVVTTWDGRSFRLSGTNDVNEENRGIFIRPNGREEVEVKWDDFAHVEFAK